jgi:hypothetical protein
LDRRKQPAEERYTIAPQGQSLAIELGVHRHETALKGKFRRESPKVGLPLTIASFDDHYGASSSCRGTRQRPVNFIPRALKPYCPSRYGTWGRHALSQALDDEPTSVLRRRLRRA